VIEELLSGEPDTRQILDRYKVSTKTFHKWLRDEVFIAELDRRIDWLRRQSELLLARYKSLAAAKLVQLTESESGETARKACLDIISFPAGTHEQSETSAEPQQQEQLSDETAGRILAALAGTKGYE